MADTPLLPGCGQAESSSGTKTVIMIAMDGSEHSYRALDWYMEHLHKPGTELIFVHCSDYKNVALAPVMSADPAAASDVFRRFEEATNKIVTQIQEKLDSLKINAKVIRLSGEAGPAIVKAAVEHKVNCIVTGSRGLGTLKRVLLGSVSNHIVHHAPCPVLVCPFKSQ